MKQKLIILFCIISCNNSTKTNSFETFNAFNIAFFSDSLFQQTRILLPIAFKNPINYIPEGERNLNENNSDTFWENSNLKFSNIYTLDTGNYFIKSEIYDTLAIQTVGLKNSGLFSKFYFVNRFNKWYLKRYEESVN
ncbi:MAG: hypothetical protein PSX81_12625 [bacterium]|nr:hypothetical protein [bacterium]